MISEVREEPDYIASGRCKSGRRWFWCVSARSYDHDERHCEDPVCSPGLTGHEYGWEDTEEEALDAMQAAGTRLSGLPWGRGIGRPTWAAEILKQINAARRRARPPKPGASEAAPVEYLYEPWSWSDYDNPPYETHRGINEIPIVKKTAKRIYHDRTDRWDRHDGVVTLGYIDRQELETDTRCRDSCQRDVPAGPVCATHGRDFPTASTWARLSGRSIRAASGPAAAGRPAPSTLRVGNVLSTATRGTTARTARRRAPATTARLQASPTFPVAATTAAAPFTPPARPPRNTSTAGNGNGNASGRNASPSSSSSAWPW